MKDCRQESYSYRNLDSSNKAKEKSYIRFTQKNSIKKYKVSILYILAS